MLILSTDQTPPRRRLHLSLAQIGVAALLILAAWTLSRVLLLIFFSILLAASLRGAADWVVGRTRLPHGLALTLVIVVVFGALGGALFWTGPVLYAQLNDLAHRLVQEAQSLADRFRGSTLLDNAPSLPSMAERVASPIASILSFSLSTTTELLVAIVTALYFASSPSIYVGGLVRLVPLPRRARVREVIEAIGHVLRMWVLGQLADMLAVGLLASFGLWIVGVPAPFALGLMSGLFTFVPYIGTIVSGLVAIVIALSASPTVAVYALLVFTVCHLVEGYVIAPLIQRRFLDMPAALTVLSMTVLGSLFGLPGIILATPLAAAATALIQAFYIGDTLGDHELDPTRKTPHPG